MGGGVEFWGRPTWRAVHALALGYDVEQAHERDEADGRDGADERRDAVERFFSTGLGDLLPCRTCRKNYRDLLKPDGEMRSLLDRALSQDPPALFDWTVELHNRVSAHAHAQGGRSQWREPPRTWTPEQARFALVVHEQTGTLARVAILIGVGIAGSCAAVWAVRRIVKSARRRR